MNDYQNDEKHLSLEQTTGDIISPLQAVEDFNPKKTLKQAIRNAFSFQYEDGDEELDLL